MKLHGYSLYVPGSHYQKIYSTHLMLLTLLQHLQLFHVTSLELGDSEHRETSQAWTVNISGIGYSGLLNVYMKIFKNHRFALESHGQTLICEWGMCLYSRHTNMTIFLHSSSLQILLRYNIYRKKPKQMLALQMVFSALHCSSPFLDPLGIDKLSVLLRH